MARTIVEKMRTVKTTRRSLWSQAELIISKRILSVLFAATQYITHLQGNSKRTVTTTLTI